MGPLAFDVAEEALDPGLVGGGAGPAVVLGLPTATPKSAASPLAAAVTDSDPKIRRVAATIRLPYCAVTDGPSRWVPALGLANLPECRGSGAPRSGRRDLRRRPLEGSAAAPVL